MINELGISNTFTKLIHTRSRNDMYLLYGCFFTLLIIIYLSFYYIRPYVRG
jgi:hypothetical protein